MRLAVLFTGLSGAGKSTISLAVHCQLLEKGITATVLDGDQFRAEFCQDLGFSEADRRQNLWRMNLEAVRLSRAGNVVLIAAIAPYRDIRDQMRAHHRSFLEVFVSAPLEVCEGRDPKGLYQQARAGLIDNFTGISSQYEEPLAPDIECRTHEESIEECSSKVAKKIEQMLWRLPRKTSLL